MKSYRLLNEGEEIQEGDECCYRSEEWTKVKHSAHVTNPLFNSYIFRRPISTGWIKLSERRPTEADADEKGYVAGKYEDGGTDLWPWSRMANAKANYYWLPLPKFEEKDGDEEAFEKWIGNNAASFQKETLKFAWDAALEYAKKKQ